MLGLELDENTTFMKLLRIAEGVDIKDALKKYGVNGRKIASEDIECVRGLLDKGYSIVSAVKVAAATIESRNRAPRKGFEDYL